MTRAIINVLLYHLCDDRSMKFYKEERGSLLKGERLSYPCKRKILGKIERRGEETFRVDACEQSIPTLLLRRSIPLRVMPRSFRFYPPHPCPPTRTRRGRIRLLTTTPSSEGKAKKGAATVAHFLIESNDNAIENSLYYARVTCL